MREHVHHQCWIRQAWKEDIDLVEGIPGIALQGGITRQDESMTQVVIDLYSHRVVGWSTDRRMKKALVIRALIMAINLRKPPPGLIHHSDRGSQYASHAYQALLKLHGKAVALVL